MTTSNLLGKQIYWLRLLSTMPGNNIEVMLKPKSAWIPLFDVITTPPVKPIHSRIILKNEIILEIDNPEWPEVRDGTRRILEVLNIWGAGNSYYLSFSGNHSIHVHVFFDRSMTIYEGTSAYLTDREAVLPAVKSYLMAQIGTAARARIDMQLSGRHLIRMEGGFNEKSRKYCTFINEIPNEKPEYYDVRIPSQLPPELWNLDRFEKEINAYLRIHFSKINAAPVFKPSGRPFDPEPLKEILKPVFIPGHRHYMVLSLAGWLKRHSIPEDKAHEIVKALNPKDRTPGKTAATIREIYKSGKEKRVPGLPKLIEEIQKESRQGEIPAKVASATMDILERINRGRGL